MAQEKGCDDHVDNKQANHDAELRSDASSTETRKCSDRKSQENRELSPELVEGKLEVLTESGDVEQVHVTLQQLPGQGFALMEESSGPIPNPQIYAQYPKDVQELIKDTYRAMAIEPSERESKFAKHAVLLSYLGFAGTLALFLLCLALAVFFFYRGNNIAGLAFVSANLLGVVAAIFDSNFSFYRRGSNKANRDD